MELTIEGTLKTIFPKESGQGAKGTWYKQGFLIETKDQYPKKVLFTAWGEKVTGILSNKSEGTDIKVFFNPESREWNGKYFTDLRAYKITGTEETAKPVQVQTNIADENDDLPF